ncbi:MAG TPA: nickel pincer cofactor biosynthesis protein LarC [Gemmatimonadales bacterium]|jgi:hypothetical protein
MTRIAILDPAAGISGDMTLGALIGAGVSPDWIKALPGRLGFKDVGVQVREVSRGAVQATKVAFDIPGDHHDHHGHDHGHGRRIGELLDVVKRAPISPWVRERALKAFELVAAAEGRVHGVAPHEVHLHEVGAVDAVLDIVGAIEGFEQLGAEVVYNLPCALGTGWVDAAHGRLPVPAPATALLLEGIDVASGGPVEGEATTPTGAALLRVLSEGRPPSRWRALGNSWGAGDRDPRNYPNALRLIVAEAAVEAGMVEVLATDVDDMSPEYLEPLRQAVFAAGALDCVVWPTQGKKGRVSLRVEVLAPPAAAGAVAEALFAYSTTAGLRRWTATRAVLPRRDVAVLVGDIRVRVKVWDAPGGERCKAEFDDVVRAAESLGLAPLDIARRAEQLATAQLAGETTARHKEN